MKSIEKFLHLVDHLGLVRPVDVMVCVGDSHHSGAWDAAAECFGPGIALRLVGGKALCSAFRVIRKEVTPIVRAGKDREDRNGDGYVLLHTEVERGLNRRAWRQRRHRLYVFIAL